MGAIIWSKKHWLDIGQDTEIQYLEVVKQPISMSNIVKNFFKILEVISSFNTVLNTENELSLRWDMMNSLRNNYKLIGMSRTEIINLLGQPNNEFSSSNSFRYF